MKCCSIFEQSNVGYFVRLESYPVWGVSNSDIKLHWRGVGSELSISRHDFFGNKIGHNDNSKFDGVGTFYHKLLIS